MKKDIRDVIRGGTKRTTIDDLQAAGHKNVRVIDEQRILELISEAVDRAVGQRSGMLLDEEAADLAGDAREVFGQLLADHHKALQVQEALSRARALLKAQIEKVRAALPDSKKGIEAGKLLDDVERQGGLLLGKIAEKDGRERELRGRVADLEAKLKNSMDSHHTYAALLTTDGDIDMDALRTPEGKVALRHQLLEVERLRTDNAVLEQALDEARGFQQSCTERMVELQGEVDSLASQLDAAKAMAGDAKLSGGDELVAQLSMQRDELAARVARLGAVNTDLVRENYALVTGETLDTTADEAAKDIVVVV